MLFSKQDHAFLGHSGNLRNGRHLCFCSNSLPVGKVWQLSQRGPYCLPFRDKDLRHLGRDKTCLLFHLRLSMQSSLGYPGGFCSLTLRINLNLVPRTTMLFHHCIVLRSGDAERNQLKDSSLNISEKKKSKISQVLDLIDFFYLDCIQGRNK